MVPEYDVAVSSKGKDSKSDFLFIFIFLTVILRVMQSVQGYEGGSNPEQIPTLCGLKLMAFISIAAGVFIQSHPKFWKCWKCQGTKMFIEGDFT